MSKVRIFRITLPFLAVFIALAGCKKDDKGTTSFKLTGDSSLHFEYSQQKSVGFSSKNIVSFAAPEYPDGWSCTVNKAASTIDITSPANDTKTMEGTVEITATTTSGTELTVKITVAVKIAQEIADPANCFIVGVADKRYKFDARRRGNETSASLTPVGAKLLWTTAKEGVGHVSLENGYIYFATDDTSDLVETNALVAALNADDEVIWSWHIWVTDNDPETQYHLITTEVGVKIMKLMKRNLGAMAFSNVSGEKACASYGLYYQWGRKDPFVGPGAWDSSTPHNIYDADNKWLTIGNKETASDVGTIDYATKNPVTFITGTKGTDYDWLFAKRDSGLWGGVSDVKTVYDPCPTGWRVVPASVWSSFTATGKASSEPSAFSVTDDYRYGWNFLSTDDVMTTTVYYPAAGRYGFTKTTNQFTNIIDKGFGEKGEPVGFYWSRDAISATQSAALVFNSTYVNPGNSVTEASPEGSRAGGFPLRCVQ